MQALELSQMGIPLTRSQFDLTPLQREVLFRSLRIQQEQAVATKAV